MLEKYFLPGALVAVAIVGIGAGVQTIRLKMAQAEVVNMQARNDILAARIGDKDAIIDRHNAATAALVKAANESANALAAAGDRAAALETTLSAERAARRKATETDHAIPDCQALLDADLAVCPAHADSVRRAAGVPGS